MGDAGLFEVLHRREQVVAIAAREIHQMGVDLVLQQGRARGGTAPGDVALLDDDDVVNLDKE